MPDLPELLKDAVGAVPPFEPAALAARARRRRRHQVGASAATATLVVALVVAVFGVDRSASGHEVALHTRGTTSTRAPLTTTAALRPTVASTTTSTPTSTDAPTTSAGTSTTTGATAHAMEAAALLGSVSVDKSTVEVSQRAVLWTALRNGTDHTVAVDRRAPLAFALVCAPMSSDEPAPPLVADQNLWFFTGDPLEPGATNVSAHAFRPAASDTGAVTCGVAIVASSDAWATVQVVAPASAIAPVTITVLPQTTTTSGSTSSTPSTT